jgi:hypothetical protein
MTIRSAALRSTVTCLAAAAAPLAAQTPSTQPEIVACYDSRTSSTGTPLGSGIVYRIKVPGVVGQTGCVDPRHTQFSWTIQHGALTGLGNDDHPQYLLVSGARSLTGGLKAGGNKVTGLAAATVAGDAVRFEQAVKSGDPAAGDLSGTYPNPSVVKLQGNPLSNAAPTNNQVLSWNGTAWMPSTPQTGANGTAGGDLTGSYPNPTVARLQGIGVKPVTNLGDRLQVLGFDGTSWSPRDIFLAGDVAGLAEDGSNQVLHLQGTALRVPPTLLKAGQFLGFDATNSQWTAMTPPSAATGAAGGDLAGSYPNPTIARLLGAPLDTRTGSPFSGAVLTWNGTAWGPSPPLNSGGTVTSVSAGAGLTGATITTTGALAVAFAGSGVATTVARSDHTHASGYEVVNAFQYVNNTGAGEVVTVQAACPAGKKAVGGGFDESGFQISSSKPLVDGSGWEVTFISTIAGTPNLATAWAVCMTAS